MNKYYKGLLILLVGSIVIGCSSDRPIYQRGWIGGNYLEANTSFLKKQYSNYFEKNFGVIPSLPGEIKQQQKGAIFVSRVYENTPIMKAGIKEGDLILKIQSETVDNIKAFREVIDKTEPGATIMLTIYRNGEIIDHPIIVGKETFQKWNSLLLGLRLGTELDLIPLPDFNILSLLSYQNNKTRLELNSPEYNYFKTSSLDSNKTQINKPNDASWEGWDAWFVILGFNGTKLILSQEILDSEQTNSIE